MSSEETLNNLREWDNSLVQDVVDQLNKIGIVSDEDDQGFCSTWIEYWDDRCTNYLRQFGYQGDMLGQQGKFFAAYGAVYALYDTGQHDQESADKYIESKVATS